MSEAEGVGIGIRADLHALDAALAEHRRALALAASRRETERMAGAREVKAAAQASADALEQPVLRPMRSLQLAETWLEIDHTRRRLERGVRAQVDGGELRVTGPPADALGGGGHGPAEPAAHGGGHDAAEPAAHGGGGPAWTSRIVIAPGERPVAAAREAADMIAAAVADAPERARARLARVVATGIAHARACHEAAAALAAADREAAERHADRARVDACIQELAERLGPRFAREPAETAAARARLDQARVHLATAPAQPYDWLDAWPPPVAGAVLRDLPEDAHAAARPAVRRLATALADDEPLLALAVLHGGSVAAVTPERLLVAGSERVESKPATTNAPEVAAEQRPGQLAATLDLVRAAGGGSEPPPVSPEAERLLRSLAELRDAGILSVAEYEAKRLLVLRRA
jgi:hypothetical protein